MQVEQALTEIGARQQGLASARQLTALVTRSALSRAVRTGRVVQVRPRVYALAPLAPLPLHVVTKDGPAAEWVAHVRAALLSVHGSAAGARTAAALHGWGLLVEPTEVVDLAVSRHVRASDRHVRLHTTRSRPVVDLPVLPGTTALTATAPAATVLRCCRELPLLEAVVVCDSALRARAVTAEELTRLAARLRGQPGAEPVRGALALADRRSGSVLESVFRVRAGQAGITGLQPQVEIVDRHGRHVLRADFLSTRARLVVELDGSRWHPDPARDQRTDNLLAELGWRVLRFGWAAVVHEPELVLAQVRAALSQPAGGWRLAA